MSPRRTTSYLVDARLTGKAYHSSNTLLSKNQLCYSSEENVWKLCQDVARRHASQLQHCYVAFVSNPWRSVPLWRQRAGKDEDKLVVWVSLFAKQRKIKGKDNARSCYVSFEHLPSYLFRLFFSCCCGRDNVFVCCILRTTT